MTSLERRFPEENSPTFSLVKFHPYLMLDKTLEEVKTSMKSVADFYGLTNLRNEIDLWYNLWADKQMAKKDLKVLDLLTVRRDAQTFFPTIDLALQIAMSLPCTTSTVERSFSTLRRVKTWTRATMVEERLSGLAMLSVHRAKHIAAITKEVVDRLTANKRRMLLR